MLLTLSTLRRLLEAAWLLGLIGLISLAAFAHFGNAFVIRGGSMAPAIPLGSLVLATAVPAEELRPGDAVTIRAENGVLVTHRVVDVVDHQGAPHLRLRGDANPTPDPALVPPTAVVGRVEAVVPIAGYVVAMMSSPAGLVSLGSLLAALLLAIWLIEEAEAELRAARDANRTRGAAPEQGSRRGAVA